MQTNAYVAYFLVGGKWSLYIQNESQGETETLYQQKMSQDVVSVGHRSMTATLHLQYV